MPAHNQPVTMKNYVFVTFTETPGKFSHLQILRRTDNGDKVMATIDISQPARKSRFAKEHYPLSSVSGSLEFGSALTVTAGALSFNSVKGEMFRGFYICQIGYVEDKAGYREEMRVVVDLTRPIPNAQKAELTCQFENFTTGSPSLDLQVPCEVGDSDSVQTIPFTVESNDGKVTGDNVETVQCVPLPVSTSRHTFDSTTVSGYLFTHGSDMEVTSQASTTQMNESEVSSVIATAVVLPTISISAVAAVIVCIRRKRKCKRTPKKMPSVAQGKHQDEEDACSDSEDPEVSLETESQRMLNEDGAAESDISIGIHATLPYANGGGITQRHNDLEVEPNNRLSVHILPTPDEDTNSRGASTTST
ncbi:hypothetical protein BaRGS_00023063 [Batillaria attramentaria]|uniref:Uncharacterized protein n=1 Tax=Batillaria attramentaria TaxID=370345 RepID=A0ABD0KFF7_9CAEN